MSKIIIIDFQSIGNFHEIVNSSLLRICSQIYDTVIYKSGKSANKNMSLYIKDCHNINLRPHPVFELNTKIGFFLRILMGFFITLYEYIKLKDKDCLLFLYTNALSMPLILLLNIVLKKKIIFMMHGELELQYKKNIPFYKPIRYYKLCHDLSFKYFVSKTPAVILVLGDSIKYNLIKIYPNINGHIISICHPYNLNTSQIKNKKITFKYPLTIGTIGLMTKDKGLEELIQLSKCFQKEIKENKLTIKSIGKVITSNLLPNNINWIGVNKPLHRDDFEKQINQLDFILYLYPKDSYKLTASGAIMDAVKMHKPIICIKNDYFEYLMGNNIIGYMVENLKGIEIIIKQLLNKKDIPNFENEFKSLEYAISISNNTKIFKKELSKINYIM